ncbi:MAG: class I SAM-dependent methyltransferase [Proteobacteria bacterium]|nr:class I SAM-dependent methyltransferase [Pseudomonadota bacterium]
MGRLDRLVEIVTAENQRQNLIARSTVKAMWARHIVDSLQLLLLAPTGTWLDIGTGAGFPGLAVAAADPDRVMILAAPRRLRADHLRDAARRLGLTRVTVVTDKVEGLREKAAIISARAVGRVGALFASAGHCADDHTVWLLPKGRNTREEVAEARRKWHGVFHVEPSITNSESAIVVARNVRRR